MSVIIEYTLPAETLLLWRIRLVFLSLGLIIVALMFCSISVYLYAIPFLFLCLCLFGVLWYLPNYFKNCKIIVYKDSVVIEKGVFIKKTHILPFARLIYTQTLSSPIAKALKLTAITLKAARMRIIVPEMETHKIEQFVEKITRGEKS